MFEMGVGLFALALGRLCFDHVSRVRALYSEERPRQSLFYGEKPLMVIPTALGVLLVLVGLALLTLAAAEWLRGANVAGSPGMTLALALVPAGIATPALLLRFTGRRAVVNPAACAP